MLLIDTNRRRDPLFCATNVPLMPNNPTQSDPICDRKLLKRRTVGWDN